MGYPNFYDVSARRGLPEDWSLYQGVECPECGGESEAYYRAGSWMWLECRAGHRFSGKELKSQTPWPPSIPLRDSWYLMQVDFALSEIGIGSSVIRELKVYVEALVERAEE